jgi:membrane protein implicated in regulation of membrane protease activity
VQSIHNRRTDKFSKFLQHFYLLSIALPVTTFILSFIHLNNSQRDKIVGWGLLLNALPLVFFLSLLYLPVTVLETGIEYVWFSVISGFIWLVALPNGVFFAVPLFALLMLASYFLHLHSMKQRESRNDGGKKENEALRVKAEAAMTGSKAESRRVVAEPGESESGVL